MQSSCRRAGEIDPAFLATAKEPAIVEPGQEPIPLVSGSYQRRSSSGRAIVPGSVDSRSHTFAPNHGRCRSETRLRATRPPNDSASAKASSNSSTSPRRKRSRPTRKATRQTYREQFRRSLLQAISWMESRRTEHRGGPGAQLIARISARPAAQGNQRDSAAIGCPPDAQDVDGVLTFGLIWLDYLRKRETRNRIVQRTRGLCAARPAPVHLPAPSTLAAGPDGMVCIRVHRPRRRSSGSSGLWQHRYRACRTRTELWTPSAHGGRRSSPQSSLCHGARRAARASQLDRPRSRVRSLGTWFRTHLRHRNEVHKARESNLPEIEALARELARFRSPAAPDRSNPLYLKKPELWLEAQARSASARHRRIA